MSPELLKEQLLSGLDAYTIDLKGMEVGSCAYEFTLDDSFFAKLGDVELRKGHLDAILAVKKTPNAFELNFDIKGTIVVTCDRCLDEMEQPIFSQHTLMVKFGDEYAEEDVPETLTIYVRMRAVLYSGYECFSNTIQLTVAPYYTELSEAEPEMWYLVGGCIADGSWDNTADGIGVNLVPMSLVAGYEYNASTGKGLLTYTGYFLANQGFKLVMTPGGWDNQWGNSGADGIDNPVKNDGASKNLLVPSDGYYTITLNTETDELTVEAVTDVPSVYHIQIQ